MSMFGYFVVEMLDLIPNLVKHKTTVVHYPSKYFLIFFGRS